MMAAVAKLCAAFYLWAGSARPLKQRARRQTNAANAKKFTGVPGETIQIISISASIFFVFS